MHVKTFAILGFEIRIGRFLSKSAERVGKVAVIDDQEIARLRVLVKTFRQQNVGAEMHGSPPKFRQQLALNLDMLDVFRLRRIRNRRDFPVKLDFDHPALGRIEADFFGRAVQISGRFVPPLTFATIHGEFEHMTVAAVKGFVNVQ